TTTGRFGKRGANPPLPRNCKRRGAASLPLESFLGRQPAANESQVRRPVQLQLPRGKYMARIHLLFPFVCLSICSLSLSPALFATSAPLMSGTITDPSGAAIVGANLDLLSHGQKIASAVTGQDGQYMLSVPATGAYELRISAAGFKIRVLEKIQASDAQPTAENVENVTLRLDTLSESVTVTATATPTLESHLGAAVTILTPVEYAGTNEVQDALRWIPGLQINQTGQIGGTTGLYIRGGNSDAN